MFALFALIITAVTILPMFMPGGELSNHRNKYLTIIPVTIGYFLADWFFLWLLMPSFAYPMFGDAIILVIIQLLISSLINFRITNLLFPASVLVITLLYAWFSTAPIWGHASEYASLIGKISDNQTIKHWSQDIEPVDPTHLRLVPEETAITLAQTSLNQNATTSSQASVGSQFNLDVSHITLQKVKTKLVYVIPLDHRSFTTYSSVTDIPGYVIVDAENPQAQPKYINTFSMKYSPESFLQHNLERHLYTNGYYNKILTDYSFELDDNGDPFWVVTVAKPTIGYSGEIVEGVVIVEPNTGHIEFKSLKEVPDWVDRVYPEDYIETYLDDYGEYSGGWWNSIWANLNVKNPESVTLNYGSDGRCYYVTPMTSSNNNDASMTDLMYTDTKTGVTRRYIVGGTTETNLINSVTTKLSYLHLKGNTIIYENVYGKMTAIVSVIGEDGSYRGAAFVDVSNKSTIAYDPITLNALRQYQNLISQSGSQIATDNASELKTITTIVNRLRYEQTANGLQLDMYIDTIPHAFYVNCNSYVDAPFTEKGDTVTFSFYNTPSSGITVNSFKNKYVKINSSINQIAVETQNKSTAATEKRAANAKDFREKSDEEIDSILNKK